MIRYGLILGLICVAASASLASINAVTKSKILAQAQAEEEDSLRSVLPGAERFEAVKSGSETLYYKAFDRGNKLVGVAFKTQGKGYSGVIETMAGMTVEGKITAIKVLSQNETPGLGANVAEEDFTDRFREKNFLELNQVEAITGATISSRAVINSVEKKAQEVKGLMENAR